MNLPESSLGAVVLVPLLAAALGVLLPPLGRRILGGITAALTTGFVGVIVVTVAGGQVLELALGGFDAPLGITLRADGFSALFLALSAVVGALVSVYAVMMPRSTGTRLVRATAAPEAGGSEGSAGHGADTSTGNSPTTTKPPDTRHSGESPQVRWTEGHPGYWPLWLGCWSGLNAVFVSGDLFNTYVGLELVALCGVALVSLGGRNSWVAALRYLFISVLGSLLFLVGVALIVSATGTLDINQAAAVIVAEPQTQVVAVSALTLVTIGMAMKVALVPMHGWLIPAHAGAPSAVSPLLSALVIKAALFVLLRCWMWLVAPGIAEPVGQDHEGGGSFQVQSMLTTLTWILAVAGVLAIIGGSFMAVRQDRLKPLIAYSTVAQAGYWFLFFPIIMDPASTNLEGWGVAMLEEDAVVAGALGGTLAMALGHGLAKAGLFLCAGYLKDVYGTDEIAALRGAGQRHPTLIMAMGLSVVGLAGLPFSLAFTGKWQLATVAVASSHYWLVAMLILGTLLSAAYLLKAMAPLLVEAEDDDTAVESPKHALPKSPWSPQLVPLALGSLTILTGFSGAWAAELLEVGAPW